MIPQPPDFFQLFAQDHQQRETVAEAERLRARHLVAPSVPPRTTKRVRRPHPARAG